MDARMTKASLEALQSTIQRMNSIDDPIIQYSLFLETIRMGADFGLRALKETFENEIDKLEFTLEEFKEKEVEPEERRKRQQEISQLETKISKIKETELIRIQIQEETMKYLDGFSLWVKQPMYGPDHPHGNQMMKSAQADLKERSTDASESSIHGKFPSNPKKSKKKKEIH